jgi:H+-transporting ATPase
LTNFQTRTRGPWWSTRPAWILLAAVGGTQAAATLIAVYGFGLVIPLSWKYAGIVWGYAFFWFLVGDPLKLLTYKVLDMIKANTKPQALAKPATASIAGPEPADEPSDKTGSDANAKPKAMIPSENHDDTRPQSTNAAAPKSKREANGSPGEALTPKAASGSEPVPKAASGLKPAPKAASGSEPAPNEASGTEPAAKAASGAEPAPKEASGTKPAPKAAA